MQRSMHTEKVVWCTVSGQVGLQGVAHEFWLLAEVLVALNAQSVRHFLRHASIHVNVNISTRRGTAVHLVHVTRKSRHA